MGDFRKRDNTRFIGYRGVLQMNMEVCSNELERLFLVLSPL